MIYKLVKEKSTNKYLKILYTDYNIDPNLYYDRSDNIVYLYNYYNETDFTFWQIKYLISQIVANSINGFNDFKNEEKEVLSILGIGNQNDIITYYVTVKNLTVKEASALHVKRLAEKTAKLSLDAKNIIASPITMQIGVKYLTWVDTTTGTQNTTQVNDLTNAIQSFLTELERYAVLGLNYGDDRVGLMDYFESTNDYGSGGLKNYLFNPDLVTLYGTSDAVRLAMIEELKEVFIKGNI